MSLSAGELATRIARGDQWAEEAFYRRNVAPVRAVVRRLLGSTSDADDVVQDAFVTAFEIWGQLREPEAAGSWLLMIAVRQVHRRFRRRRLMRLLGLDQSVDDASLASLARMDASSEDRAELALVDRALQRVPTRERIAWMLRHVEGMPLEEVASACECSRATVKRRIASAHLEVMRHIGRERSDE